VALPNNFQPKRGQKKKHTFIEDILCDLRERNQGVAKGWAGVKEEEGSQRKYKVANSYPCGLFSREVITIPQGKQMPEATYAH